ncbi:hypothetical protein HK098_002386 [Nowakowskiella sp. JEL0407]|nr:hypothetical protein HK098_002386 [Nowakowskiella sp. JEL0407]
MTETRFSASSSPISIPPQLPISPRAIYRKKRSSWFSPNNDINSEKDLVINLLRSQVSEHAFDLDEAEIDSERFLLKSSSKRNDNTVKELDGNLDLANTTPEISSRTVSPSIANPPNSRQAKDTIRHQKSRNLQIDIPHTIFNQRQPTPPQSDESTSGKRPRSKLAKLRAEDSKLYSTDSQAKHKSPILPNVFLKSIAPAAESTNQIVSADLYDRRSVSLPHLPETRYNYIKEKKYSNNMEEPEDTQIISQIKNTLTSICKENKDDTLQSRLLNIVIISEYLTQLEILETLASFNKEAGIPVYSEKNFRTLRKFLELKQFNDAVQFVKEIANYQEMTTSKKREKLKQSTQDLIYVIYKYLFIQNLENSMFENALSILENEIHPIVEKQINRANNRPKKFFRGKWFEEDYNKLQDWLHTSQTSFNQQSLSFKLDWNWDTELNTFWSAGVSVWLDTFISLQIENGYTLENGEYPFPAILNIKENSPPLFAYALAEWFLGLDVIIENVFPNLSGNEQSEPRKLSTKITLPALTKGWEILTDIKNLVQNVNVTAPVFWQPQKISKRKKSAIKSRIVSAGSHPDEANSTTSNSTLGLSARRSSLSSTPQSKQKESDRSDSTYVPDAVLNANANKKEINTTKSKSAVQTRVNTAYTITLSNHDEEANLDNFPPASKIAETSDFALSSVCGPTLGQVRAMDVTVFPETDKVITATAGEDRTNRKISIWNVKSGHLLCQLENTSPKPIVSLQFHPTNHELIMSSDMEFDVKLWNWKSAMVSKSAKDQVSDVEVNPLLRHWRKLHSRIIYKTAFIPGKDDAKTPITTLNSHPNYDNYILISCDNQIRLYDLTTQSLLKVYSARQLGVGLRIEGKFSPCGNYVYSGTWDIRSFASSPRKPPKKPDSVSSLSKYSNKPWWDGHNDSEATGIYIWKLHTGKLEKNDMRAMEESAINASNSVLCSGGDEFETGKLEKVPVFGCKWYVLLLSAFYRTFNDQLQIKGFYALGKKVMM